MSSSVPGTGLNTARASTDAGRDHNNSAIDTLEGAGGRSDWSEDEKRANRSSDGDEKDADLIDGKPLNAQDEEEIEVIRDQILLDLEKKRKTETVDYEAPGLFALFKRGSKRDPEEIATQSSVFDDPALAQYFEPSPKYENRHRWDPSAKWTWAEEKALVRKIDWRVTTFAFAAFFALDIGRGELTLGSNLSH